MIYIRVALLTISFVGVSCAPPGLLAYRQARVLALVIGVTDYEDGKLKHAVPSAEAFRAAVKDTYPKAHIWHLSNADADAGRVREILFKEMPDLADPYSLLIIYFAGHGARQEYKPGTTSDVFLLLSGATQRDYVRHSIRAQELLDAVMRTAKCNVMMILDCCFSGADRIAVVDDADGRLHRLGVRAFMLASSSYSEQSDSGLFTQILLDVWKKARDDRQCLNPRDLQAHVQKVLREKAKGFMNCSLVCGDYIQQCFVELNQQAWLLVCEVPKGCKYAIRFELDTGARQIDLGTLSTPTEGGRAFVRHIPRGKATLRAYVFDDKHKVIVHKAELDPDKRSDDVVEEKIEVQRDWQEGYVPRARASSTLETAMLVEAFGANASQRYLEAARLHTSADPECDTSAMLRAVLRQAPKESKEYMVAQLGIGLATPYEVRPGEDIADDLLRVGRYGSAGQVLLSVASQSSDKSRRHYLIQYGLRCFKAAGVLPRDAQTVKTLAGGHFSKEDWTTIEECTGTLRDVSPREMQYEIAKKLSRWDK